MCPFSCTFCCVSAIHVPGLRQLNIERDKEKSIAAHELSFKQKVAIIDQMKPGDFQIDFSGGDVLIDPTNVDLILYASEKCGSSNIGLSIPGTFLSDVIIAQLKGKIHTVEITLDNIPVISDKCRPHRYPQIAEKALKKLVSNGYRVGVQTVLRRDNIDQETLKSLYNLLKYIGVQEWSLLKLLSVGRYANRSELIPSDASYKKAVDFIQNLAKETGSNPKPNFQYLLPKNNQRQISCRAVTKSFGINPIGKVSACFWALDKQGEPFEKFVLGKLPEENIYDILSSEKANYWRSRKTGCDLLKYVGNEYVCH
jgi:MoaA/NifB/PqqE/SkfB family radical SAM enzyme